MGQEATCRCRFEGALSEGKAHLESDRLIFRGTFRLSIPFSDIRSLESTEGNLEIVFSQGTARFDLGHPKSRIDKLGIKPNTRVALVGKLDEDFLKELKKATSDISEGRPRTIPTPFSCGSRGRKI